MLLLARPLLWPESSRAFKQSSIQHRPLPSSFLLHYFKHKFHFLYNIYATFVYPTLPYDVGRRLIQPAIHAHDIASIMKINLSGFKGAGLLSQDSITSFSGGHSLRHRTSRLLFRSTWLAFTSTNQSPCHVPGTGDFVEGAVVFCFRDSPKQKQLENKIKLYSHIRRLRASSMQPLELWEKTTTCDLDIAIVIINLGFYGINTCVLFY